MGKKAWILLFGLMATSQSKGLTLQEAFLQAKKKTAIVQNAQRDVSIAELQSKQSWAAVSPTVTARSINVWRDALGGGGVQARFGEAYQHTALINLTQPIFAGTSEYFFLDRISKQPELAKLQKLDAENQLLFEVASQFYNILIAEADVKNQKRQKELLQGNLNFLKKRASIGRVRKADVLATESRLSSVESDLLSLQSRLRAAKAEFFAQIGAESSNETLIDDVSIEKESFDKQVWLEQAKSNPLLKQLEVQIQQTEAQKKEARGGFFPTVDLDGNYYLDRAGILRDSEWDITVTASWELFSGGEDYREYQIQNINLRKQQSELADLKRQLNASVVAAVVQVGTLERELSVLKTAVTAAEASYQENEKDRRRGLVTELEVLNSLDTLVTTQTAYDRKYFDAKLLYISLLRAVGRTL